MYTAAGSSVIHSGTDSSRTYIRHTIQFHISVPFNSDLCDVTVAQVLATMRTQKPASSQIDHFQCHRNRKFVFVSELKLPSCDCVKVKQRRKKTILSSMKTK